MSDINVDDFYKDAARALVTLYGVFPRRHTLFVEDVCGPQEPDEFGVHGNRHLACFHALLWLAEEGLIRYADTIRQEALDQVVLTGRCFTLLSASAPELSAESVSAPESGIASDGGAAAPSTTTDALPPSVRLERSTRISGLRAALKSRSSLQVRNVMLNLLEQSTRPGH